MTVPLKSHPVVQRVIDAAGTKASPLGQVAAAEDVLRREGYSGSPEISTYWGSQGQRVTRRLYRNAVDGGHVSLDTSAGENASVQLIPAKVVVKSVELGGRSPVGKRK